ncbi:peptidase M23-like protein [Hydrogenoanaerobacterium saccharovorans]|uniref:Peptidase family M23 n=1 Tax=Hydrogenoanaerobacterium saccharovorans TaxID=474960 RepID=A0A1H7Z7L1_9FIRM|nr:M23 family metallopeptidase [Hydrogenoanaerobacterium saccharovorans]RPF48817.1 peptidase M23-like protein [Hydrogenoanaerobacterium saccharovorans]SEM53558.1 Peptidase family M23 [Hydrogenoanaerobacterium saccharovorans]
MMSRAERNQARQRSSHRQYGQSQRQDAILSTMLAQITVCLILLVLAYCFKISGLPIYENTKAAVSELLGQELHLSFIDDVMSRWNVQLPVWSDNKEQPQPQQPSSQASEKEQSQLIDSELAGYIEEYLPQDTQPESSADETTEDEAQPSSKTKVSGENNQDGQGGGINPVRLVGTKRRLTAPNTATLSPFFITDKPILPVKLGTLTCRFGFRKHPITGKDDFHTGVDIAALEGTPISAVLNGTVTEIGESAIYGNFIVIQHSVGFETVYCHCSEILAPAGAVVRQREIIAKVGSTGMSTGSHVHLEFKVNGLQANPAWVYDEF